MLLREDNSLTKFARPCVVPLHSAGVPTGSDGRRAHDGPRKHWIYCGDALERAQLLSECGSGCLRSLFAKNMTRGIEASLTTTPENGQRLAG